MGKWVEVAADWKEDNGMEMPEFQKPHIPPMKAHGLADWIRVADLVRRGKPLRFSRLKGPVLTDN